MATRYQYGTLTLRKRRRGLAKWQFRWMEDGKPKSVLVGNVKDYPTKAAAERAIKARRSKLNAENHQERFRPITVNELIEKFMKEHAPRHCRRLTQKVYQSLFQTHITPTWGDQLIQNMRTMAVEEWLHDYPHSRQVKYHVRNLMHVLY